MDSVHNSNNFMFAFSSAGSNMGSEQSIPGEFKRTCLLLRALVFYPECFKIQSSCFVFDLRTIKSYMRTFKLISKQKFKWMTGFHIFLSHCFETNYSLPIHDYTLTDFGWWFSKAWPKSYLSSKATLWWNL